LGKKKFTYGGERSFITGGNFRLLSSHGGEKDGKVDAVFNVL